MRRPIGIYIADDNGKIDNEKFETTAQLLERCEERSSPRKLTSGGSC
jgi:hypothetical protein